MNELILMKNNLYSYVLKALQCFELEQKRFKLKSSNGADIFRSNTFVKKIW